MDEVVVERFVSVGRVNSSRERVVFLQNVGAITNSNMVDATVIEKIVDGSGV